MKSELHNLLVFLGHLHPLLVHLPIGALVGLGVLELLEKFTRFKGAAQNSRLIVGLAAAASAAAAVCGWLLASSGEYDAQLLWWHRWTGTAVALGCATTFLLSLRCKPGAYRLALCATLAVLVVASHLGGSITHGRDFLAFRMPTAKGPRLIQAEAYAAAAVGAEVPHRQSFFADFVQPILQEHCITCHGPEKHKADLRLDTLEGLRKGGSNGAVVVPGSARDSVLLQRLLLPRGSEDHMPPEGKPQLSARDIASVQWWIDHEAR